MYRSKLIFLLPWWRSEYSFLQRPRYDDNVELTLGFTSTTNLLWTSLSSQILLEEMSRPMARRSTIELWIISGVVSMALEKFKCFNYFHIILVYSFAVFCSILNLIFLIYGKFSQTIAVVQFIPHVGILSCTSKFLRLSFKILKSNFPTHCNMLQCLQTLFWTLLKH